MEITITITCDNAAFEGAPAIEVSRILKELVEKIENSDEAMSYRTVTLRDYNGNKVGRMEISD